MLICGSRVATLICLVMCRPGPGPLWPWCPQFEPARRGGVTMSAPQTTAIAVSHSFRRGANVPASALSSRAFLSASTSTKLITLRCGKHPPAIGLARGLRRIGKDQPGPVHRLPCPSRDPDTMP